MGCYQCNSPEGSDVVLCPACRERRKQERSHISPIASANLDAPRSFSMLSGMAPIGLGVLALAALVYFLGFSSAGPMLAHSRHERVYQHCMSMISRELQSMPGFKSTGSAGDKFARAIHDGLIKAMQRSGPQMCAKLRDECRQDAKRCEVVKHLR